jgi:Flp pilus assembly protein TadD
MLNRVHQRPQRVAVSLIAAVLLGSAALAQAEAPRYAGREQCVPCHRREADLHAGSHHDLAMQPADATTVLGDFDGATFSYAGVTSTFFRKDGAYYVRTDGSDGKLHEYRIAYTFGVSPLQQYLIAFPDGRLQALSICWDTLPKEQGGQRWFHLYPDERVTHEDILHWTGPYQNWNDMCAECHSTNVRKNYRADTDRFDTQWSEINVSCEACHGPGSEHVAWAEDRKFKIRNSKGKRQNFRSAREKESRGVPGTGPAGGNGLLVTFKEPAEWVFDKSSGIAVRSRPRQSHVEVETCARCHSRRSVIGDDYVHGGPLLNTHRPALLAPPLFEVDGQIKEEVYEYQSFLQSKMYAAGVTCSDCHEPHRLKVSADNAVCARCHLPARFNTRAHHFHEPGSAGAQCVACHMPARLYMVVDSRRDHSFRVPRPDLSLKLGTPNACSGCHADRPLEWAAGVAEKWWGPKRASQPHYGEGIHAAWRNLPGAEQKLVAVVQDPLQPGIVRGSALDLLAAYLSARSLPAIERGLADGDPLVRWGALSALRQAEPRLRARSMPALLADPIRLLRIEAGRGLAGAPAEHLSPPRQARARQALEEFRRAQLVSADRAEAHLNLGALHAELREYAAAEREYRTALKLSPRLPATYLNLADLYRQQSSDDRGEQVLRDGLRVAPDDPHLHHALGLLFVRERRYADAMAPLARAAELAPDEARYAYVYAVALHSSGAVERALALLKAAHERHPGDVDVLLALATSYRDAGNPGAALDCARKLVALMPGNPQATALLKEIEARADAAGEVKGR